MIRPLVALSLLCAACGTPPEFLPPPFGPGNPTATRFFYPTGLAPLPDGSLLVANGNFNHAFDGGTLVTVRKSYLDAFFAKKLQCDVAPDPQTGLFPDGCDDDVRLHPDEVFGGAVIIGNYAGPIGLDDTGTLAFTGARDTGRLSAVSIHPDLTLSCAPGAGTTPDCRQGSVDLTANGVLGPYAVVPGNFLAGGQQHPVMFVSAMIPQIEQISGSNITTSAHVAAVDLANPSQVLFTMISGSLGSGATSSATGPMVFDAARRRLVLGGCFQRFVGGSGEPGTGPCAGGTNLLRFLDVDGQGSAVAQFVDIFPDVNSTDTTALALGAPDPVTGVPGTLWATMRNPDVLVQIALPAEPSVAPRVRRVQSLPVSPADVVRIPRAGKADLIAVVAEKVGALAIYDEGAQEIVAEVEHLGDSPFGLKLLSSDGTSARLATTVFRSCSVALIEVPLDEPWNAALRGRSGRCP